MFSSIVKSLQKFISDKINKHKINKKIRNKENKLKKQYFLEKVCH